MNLEEEAENLVRQEIEIKKTELDNRLTLLKLQLELDKYKYKLDLETLLSELEQIELLRAERKVKMAKLKKK